MLRGRHKVQSTKHQVQSTKHKEQSEPMKYIDEYRQGEIAAKLAEQIAAMTSRPLKLMEVCGGHTHSIFKYGIEDLLPPNIEMIHGPGCPVCVIPLGRV